MSHLGEIDRSQESAWRNTLEVFDETRQQATLRLFEDGEPVAGAPLARVQVKRETVDWEKAPRLLVVNRPIEPGSEFRVHRQWFDQSATGELLAEDVVRMTHGRNR